MRTTYLLRGFLGILLLCSLGCSSNKGKIENTKWRSVAATVDGEKLREGWMVLEFGTDNKRLILTRDLLTWRGTYSLGSGNNVTFDLDAEFNGSKSHAEKISVSGDTLTMTDSDGTTLTFNKSK
jgi:hypothetical protein